MKLRTTGWDLVVACFDLSQKADSLVDQRDRAETYSKAGHLCCITQDERGTQTFRKEGDQWRAYGSVTKAANAYMNVIKVSKNVLDAVRVFTEVLDTLRDERAKVIAAFHQEFAEWLVKKELDLSLAVEHDVVWVWVWVWSAFW